MKWGLIAACAGAAVAGGAFLYYNSGEQRALRLCEGEIGATLKAPSTYRLIEKAYFPDPEPPSLHITYEAENSFGVPLRSSGVCTLNPDITFAVWGERAVGGQ